VDQVKDQNGNGHAENYDAQITIPRESLSVNAIIDGLVMGHPENIQLANVPPIILEEIDHLALALIKDTRETAVEQIDIEDWEPTVEELIALFQQGIFWLQFFATLLYREDAPTGELSSP